MNIIDEPFKTKLHKTVISIDDYCPHICMSTLDGNYHIFPKQLIEDWIEGRQKIQDCDDWELIIKAICREWLKNL